MAQQIGLMRQANKQASKAPQNVQELVEMSGHIDSNLLRALEGALDPQDYQTLQLIQEQI